MPPGNRPQKKKKGKNKGRKQQQPQRQPEAQTAAAAAAQPDDDPAGGAAAARAHGGATASGTAAAMVERARHAQDSVEPELALKFYQRALQLTPDDPALLDETADLLLQLGAGENAKALLQRSIELAPEGGAGKWLYMAQLCEGEEALGHYAKGVQLLEAALADQQQHTSAAVGGSAGGGGGDDHAPQQGLRVQLCAACCAVAELYMTDLCFAPDAETQCQAALDKALAHDAGGPEPHQAMAHLRLSQGRPADAVPYAKEAARRLHAAQQARERETMADIDEDEGGEGGAGGADYGFRVSAAKVLMECADVDASCCEDALAVLSGLMQEDDEDVETWFLMGAAFFKMDPPDLELARSHLERAADMLEKIREALLAEAAVAARGGASAKRRARAEFQFPYEAQAALVQEQLALVEEAEADPELARSDGDGEGAEEEGDGMDTDE